jgi:uncharacterized protein YcgI (DUF1989 family)
MATSDISGEIAGGFGKAIPLRRGHQLRIENTFGSQVVDTWALNWHDTSEYFSVEHTRRMIGALFLKKGDRLFTNRRNEILRLDEDTSPGQHDMLLACCDKWLYKHYGCPPGHRNCRDNFLEALFEAGFDAINVPNPLNLWMNIPVTNNRDISIGTPLSSPGDFVVLTALIDAIVVLSACPMDVTPINGEDRTPRPVHFQVIGGDGG